mmetsp:Transcript_3708/g.5197  ORF Transcript_3708/g.5197 Transcript_3708/m.5197 type:complete len:254 (+) Transcript_3708:152-913(+)
MANQKQRCTHLLYTEDRGRLLRKEEKVKDDYYVIEPKESELSSGVLESIERSVRVREYAENTETNDSIVCEKCLDSVITLLERKMAAARQRASQYVASERSFLLETELCKKRENINLIQKKILEKRDSLQFALHKAINEAKLTRQNLLALQETETLLDVRQRELCHRANHLQLQSEHFRHACALIVANSERQSRHNLRLHSLAKSLAKLDPDNKASFASIDAYLRETARDLNTIFGTGGSSSLGEGRLLRDGI